MVQPPVLAFVLISLFTRAAAQDRPAEEELFGAPASAAPKEGAPSPPAGPAPPASGGGEGKNAGDELEGEAGAQKRLLGALARTDNPLQIGGLIYLRSVATIEEHTSPSQWPLSAPCLTDLYLDTRPTDRVRGFVLGRMLFDPTQGSTVSLGPAGLAVGPSAANPRVLLDQLWLRFDVARTAFLTVGRQHVKWGVGRFWNPTDFLHALRRNPLDLFDERTGTFMARVHFPWEARGWNFYAMAVLEPVGTQAETGQAGAASGGIDSQLGGVGGAGRAEFVLGGWELGIDGLAQRGLDPRLGVDLSGGIGEIDLRGEVALRTGSDLPLYSAPSLTALGGYYPTGLRPQATVGAEWVHNYTDKDAFTIGLEYFYNANGYRDRTLYPTLLYNNSFTPFYLGRHYAGVYASLPKPGSWNLHTFTLTVLGNLSDKSAVARLDWNMALLTYLTLEAYLQQHFGEDGGEFRLSIDADFPVPQPSGEPAIFHVAVGAPVVDFGLGLRLAL